MPAKVTRQERRAQTRGELVDAADALFRRQGFHATSLDQVAQAAGYTKGAVYSNFTGKEDLFLAVYERRVEDSVARSAEVIDRSGDEWPVALAEAARAQRDAGWLAALFEFWAHVLRNPASRERFLALHLRAQEPLVEATRRSFADEPAPGLDAARWTRALYAMVTGVSLEQLLDPALADDPLAARMLESAMAGARRR